MFPAQTSFIPVSVALAKFIAEGGSVWGNYPYWYLGSTPFRYLTGPVVPGILVSLSRILPNFSLFDLSLLLVIVSLMIGSIGWGLFSWRLSGHKRLGIYSGVLSLILPWHLFSSMVLGEVSAILASSLTPFVLLSFVRLAKEEFGIRVLLAPTLAFSLLLLVNTTASIPAILGMFLIGLVVFKKPSFGFKRALVVIIIGWVLTLWWYGFGFWITVVGAPSVGGKTLIGAFISLVNSLRTFIPVILAVVFVWWRVKPKNNFEKFSLFWLAGFVTLSFFRFISDFRFWMDWTAWMGEVEVGLLLIIAYLLRNGLNISASKKKLTIIIPILAIFILGWYLVINKRDFWIPRKSIGGTVEQKIATKLATNVYANETVLLSGTSAFWLNALVDVGQVRGGRDEVAVNNDWRKVVWEVRTGDSGEQSVVGLKALGIGYLVVHAKNSKEYYHDIENPAKFKKIDSVEKIFGDGGDIIYRVR